MQLEVTVQADIDFALRARVYCFEIYFLQLETGIAKYVIFFYQDFLDLVAIRTEVFDQLGPDTVQTVETFADLAVQSANFQS